MGRQRRPQPKLLAVKLKQIRLELGLTQQEMAQRLGKVPSAPDGAMISRYERGEREPSLFVLLAYGNLIGLAVDNLIDDRVSTSALIKAIR